MGKEMKDILLHEVSKSYGDKLALSPLSCRFPAGETGIVIGPSGCGKTTLFKLLMGLEQPDSGYMEGLEGLSIAAVFQEDRLLPAFSVMTNIKAVTGKSCSDKAIIACLESLGLGAAVRTPVASLSGGMKRRVAIARALLYPCDIMLLDEPFKGLDVATKKAVMDHVLRVCKGKTLLCITHDRTEAEYLQGQITELVPAAGL